MANLRIVGTIIPDGFTPDLNGVNTPVVEDILVKGGLHTLADGLARNAFPLVLRKAGMVVVTQDDLKLWTLGSDFNPLD